MPSFPEYLFCVITKLFHGWVTNFAIRLIILWLLHNGKVLTLSNAKIKVNELSLKLQFGKVILCFVSNNIFYCFFMSFVTFTMSFNSSFLHHNRESSFVARPAFDFKTSKSKS